MPNETKAQTLERALRAHAIAEDELFRRHRPLLRLVQRVLGVVPHAARYLEIWPPAFETYNLMVPAFLDIPRCDLGLGISPDLRSLAAYVSSRSFGCAYCSAHTAVMGTVFRGPGGSLDRNKEALEAETCPVFTGKDRAVARYAAAVGALPSQVSAEHRAGLASHLKPVDEEAVVLATTTMGFLNRFMDALGTVLEWEILKAGEAHLSASGWAPGAHDPRLDGEHEPANRLQAPSRFPSRGSWPARSPSRRPR